MGEAMALIASELLTNAVEATGTTKAEPDRGERETLPLVAVRLRVCDRALTVEVWDTSRTLPRMRTPDADAETGRGLQVVTLLSERWDSYRHPSGGKVVYAVLPLAREMTDRAGDAAEPDPRTVRTLWPTNPGCTPVSSSEWGGDPSPLHGTGDLSGPPYHTQALVRPRGLLAGSPSS